MRKNPTARASFVSSRLASRPRDSPEKCFATSADAIMLTLYGPTDSEKFRPRVTHGRVLRASDFGSQETRAIPLDAALREVEALLEVRD